MGWPSRGAARARAAGVPRTRCAEFLDGLVSHYVLDDGKLVVAHAGMKEEMQGRGSGAVRDFALYRRDDRRDRRVRAAGALQLGRRVSRPSRRRLRPHACAGGRMAQQHHQHRHRLRLRRQLTALRYPERELVSVPAAHIYCEPASRFSRS